MKRSVKYLIFNAFAIVAAGFIIYFGRQHATSWVYLPELAWIAIVAVVNIIMIAREPRDLGYELAKACRKSAFSRQLESIEGSYHAVASKADFFAKRSYQGPISDAYALIRKQMERNVQSALEISEACPEGTHAQVAYMDELAQYSDQLVQKQAQLLDQAIRLHGIKEDVDTSFVSDYIRAMDVVLKSEDLTYDTLAAKYADSDAAAPPESADPADAEHAEPAAQTADPSDAKGGR